MTSSSAPRRRSLPAALASLLLAAAVLLVPASPASAHDELVSTDPSADAVLETLPERITLTFSADVLTDAGATVIEVTDAAGTSLADGAPEPAGAEVTQALAGPASGAVTVKWRVVSSDGHPIDGSFAFTVPEAAPTPTATPTTPASTSPSPAASASAAPTEAATPTAAPVEESSAASPLPWILLAVALVIVAGVLVYVFASRGRRNTAGGGTAGR
ncbi:copper resistance protein CopC [Microbacterium sp. KSW2-29]|uniref:Copper resistance protein CopC n=1 Tax=Microbacterium phycohabitans TaxID=3075993 RepID=A0ABU3SQS5_9MICO|nr:copper resistance protein CopC [Microbacterium sp. KSW2-29]MDU0347070.1 copper resistance protein CopC [Microbacterium sp. KSW2-29]